MSETTLFGSRPWRPAMTSQYCQELSRLEQLLNNAPVLIGTNMKQHGCFELAWSMDKKTLMVWATSKTWDYILKTVVKQNQTNQQYYVDINKRNDFLDRVSNCGDRSYLRPAPLSLLRRLLRRVKPWKNESIINKFGEWVEVAYLLPSYIYFRFGPELQLAHNREKQYLELALQYANEARNFLNSRGCLLGFGVGESGLWLDGNPIYLPRRNFRLIWGLGGRSDFALQANDGQVEYVEYWDLKTRSPNRRVSNKEELVNPTYLEQVRRQAPMQLIYSSGQRVPNIIPVQTIKRVEKRLSKDDILPAQEELLEMSMGVLGVGCDQHGKVIYYSQMVQSLKKESILFEAPTDSLLQKERIEQRPVVTMPTEQWYQHLAKPDRAELGAEVLKEAVHQLVEALMQSDEWDSILQALDEHWLRKWGT